MPLNAFVSDVYTNGGGSHSPSFMPTASALPSGEKHTHLPGFFSILQLIILCWSVRSQTLRLLSSLTVAQ